MKKKPLTALLLTLFLTMSMVFGTGPAFAAGSSAKAQANAYNKHSIGLTSVSNARELGGYKTKDGRTVKFGKLLRTGELTDLSAADQKKLEQKYHVKKIVDFRSNRNILMDGQDPELKNATRAHYPYSSTLNLLLTSQGLELGKGVLVDITRQGYNGNLTDSYFMEGYKTMYVSSDGIAMFRGFFHELLDANGDTVLWHCVSGKDRTGNATAMLLYVLGVDRETIIQDFLLSNGYLKEDRQETYDMVYRLTNNKTIAKDIARKDAVRRSWIEASFETIETQYGSVDNFLHKVIGLSKKDIQKLQKAYLK